MGGRDKGNIFLIGGAFCEVKNEIRRRRKRGRGGNSFSPHPFFFPPRPSENYQKSASGFSRKKVRILFRRHKGILDALVLVPAGGLGAYKVYLDNFVVAPANTLTFSLDAGAPAGASINPVTGVFTWTPTEAQGPGVYPITVRVTDNGQPPKSATRTFTVTVNDVNNAPVVAAIPNKTVRLPPGEPA